MKIIVNIFNHLFLFASKHKEIIEYIGNEYEPYVILENISGQDYHYIDIDALSQEKNYTYDAIIRNTIINTICEDGLYYLMHAGIVIANGTAILICGRTMSGKSTACYLMNEMYGLKCMTDDIAFINKLSLSVNWIKCPIKLRESVANKYGLKERASSFEYNDRGEGRYGVNPNNYDVSNDMASIGIIIEIRYVEDIHLQSSLPVSGKNAILTILSNSYSQNRLYDSYDTIVSLAKNAIVKKVTYHDPQYLYNEIVRMLEEKNNGQ